MMAQQERHPHTTQPLRRLIHIPGSMKELFGKRRCTNRANKEKVCASKSIGQPTSDILPQRDPLTTGPLKSLHVTFNSKILSRDTIQNTHTQKDNQKQMVLREEKITKHIENQSNNLKENLETFSNKNQHPKKENTLYTKEKMKELEQSILFWLRSLGMLPIHKPIPVTLEEIEEEIRNGTLLCNLVEFIVGEPIIGVTKNPKIEASAKSNISKGLEPLRNKKRMYQKHMIEEDILNGNKITILALFEDIRRYYDGIPQRNSKTKSPYLGNYPPLGLGAMNYNFHNIPPIPNDLMTTQQINKQSLIQQMMTSNFNDSEKFPPTSSSPTELKSIIPTPTKYSTVEQRVFPEPFFPSSQLKSVFLPSPTEINQTINLMNKDSNFKQTNIQLQQLDEETIPTDESKEHEFWEESKKKKFILSWIDKGLGVKFFSETLFEELRNGTKLAEIVARCELTHELKGVERNPKKMAHKINNVNRALSLLREHKDMTNCKFIWSTNDIVNGNVNVIWGLLSDLFSCYCKSKSKYLEE